MNKSLIKLKTKLFIGLLICVFPLVHGQTKYTKKANALFSEATFWYQKQNMEKAQQFFQLTLKKEKKYFEAYNGLALIAEYYHDYELANIYYTKALEILPKYKINYYKIARNSHVLERYSEAKEWIEKYFERERFKSKTYKKAEVLKQSIELALQYNTYKFKNKRVLSDSVNTLNDEYLPTINIDASELIFTKAYRNSMNLMTEDFFYTQKKEDGSFKKAVLLEGPFNTPENEGAICMTADGKTIIYTACGKTDSYGSCDLYKSDFVNGKWTLPKNMGEQINSKSWESQPSISPDGKRLYFVSNRAGGLGHRDIWFCEKDENGEWSYPINCGENVNTTSDEMSPFIHWDNKHLYFASKGHPGIGGYDLFMSEHKVSKQRFTKPVNLEFPINTPLDNNGLIVEQNGYSAYYISEQIKDSILNHDIISVELRKDFRSETTHFLYANVVDYTTQLELDAQVEIKRISDSKTVFKQKTAYGRFFACLNKSDEYAVFITKPGYLYFSEHISPPKNRSGKWTHNFELKSMQIGHKMVLKNIFFKFDSDEIVSTSNAELTKIETLLNSNKAMKIAIIGHTDNVGETDYNLALSKNRASKIKEYLVSKGILKSRIKIEGKGEKQPLVLNDSEQNKALNRRTELVILNL